MAHPVEPRGPGRGVRVLRDLRPALLAALVAVPAPPSPASGQRGAAEAPIVTTRHEMTLDGRTLSYMARAGLLPIRDNEDGEVLAHIFFVAYTLDSAPDQPARPLTFLWNGGPGMNSSLIHLLGFGPKRVKTGDAFPTSPPPSETELVDNQETWLDRTDLVFVDPVGTGYSRPTQAEYASAFYQRQGDVEAVAEFIRVYIVRFDAWDAPRFIVGHSYGTTRAMGVADALTRRGFGLDGVALLSGGFSIGQDPLPTGFDTALAVPGMAAAAFYHGRLAPELQRDLERTLREAEEWAQDEYASALARRDELSDGERAAVLVGLSRYTGLDESLLDRSTLTVDRDRFRTGLLTGRILGRYDLRVTRPADPTEQGYDIFKDPSFAPVLGLVQGTSPLLNRYLRSELRFESDLLYQGPLGGGYPPGETLNRRFDRRDPEAGAASGGRPRRPPLRRAMDANPLLRVFVARGLYDSGSCFRHLYDVRHLEPGLASRVAVGCYGAGHDMYTDKEVRIQLKRDIASFIRQTLAGVAAATSSE